MWLKPIKLVSVVLVCLNVLKMLHSCIVVADVIICYHNFREIAKIDVKCIALLDKLTKNGPPFGKKVCFSFKIIN